MKNTYLALIRRTEFNSLLKYGRLLLNNELRHFADDLEGFVRKIKKVDFDDTFSYLIIKYEKNVYWAADVQNSVDIRDVQNVYPLDDEAKREFEISFDPRIKIENPLFDISDVLKWNAIEDCKRGIKNVWKIFGFSDEDEIKCQKIVTDRMVELAVNQMFSDKTIEGEYPLWVYLMRYERHSYYPKETLGYFMDVVHIYCNFTSKGQTPDEKVEGTAIFKQLSSIDLKNKLDEVYAEIESSAFCVKLNQLEPKCNFLKVAVIYLIIRDKYAEGLKCDEKFVELCKRWGDDFLIASYLLGIYLGYGKTYDCLYDKNKLSFFKSQAEMDELQRQHEIAKRFAEAQMQDPPAQTMAQNTTLFGQQETIKPKRTRRKAKDGK